MWISRAELIAYGDLCKRLGRNEVLFEAFQKSAAESRERTAKALARNDEVLAKVRRGRVPVAEEEK
jgi:hypothetical protein